MGILAAREMAMAGMGPIHTTSRSGRLADTRPEIMMIMDQLQQIAEHTRWRVDGSDSGSMNDIFAAVQKIEPENPMLAFDPAMNFNKIEQALTQRLQGGYKFTVTEVQWLERIKTDFEEVLRDLKAKNKNKAQYTKESHIMAVQVEDKYERMCKLLAAVGPGV